MNPTNNNPAAILPTTTYRVESPVKANTCFFGVLVDSAVGGAVGVAVGVEVTHPSPDNLAAPVKVHDSDAGT